MNKLALASGVLALSLLASDALAESRAATVVDISNLSVTEGHSGKTPFSATLRVSGVGSSVTLNVFASPGTALSSDYEFTPVQVTLRPGVPQEVTGYVIGDLLPEGDESFRLSATMVGDGGSPYPYYIYSSGGNVTIVDDDNGSGLHVEGASVAEGELKRSIEVRVRLEPASALTVTVGYRTEGANPGTDYVSSSGQLTFQPGEVLKIIPLTIMGNTYWEPDKKIAVSLSSPQNALLGTPMAEVVIVNDDQPTRISLGDLTLNEGHVTDVVPVTIDLDRPAPPNAKVHVWTVNGTATDGADFRKELQTLYPDPGASQVKFKLEIVGDTQPECDKGFFIHYEGVYMGDDTERVAKVLLRDDDGPVADCPGPFSASTPVDGGRPDFRDPEPTVTIREDGGRSQQREASGSIPPPDARFLPDSRWSEDLSGGSAPNLDMGAGSIPSDTRDAGVSQTKLSRGSGACAYLPGGRGGLGSLAALGLALAWFRARRRSRPGL